MAHIGIAGAGLLGRLLAWRLGALGHQVEVFDPADGPHARFHTADAKAPQCAGFSAAGMLSPVAELDKAEPALAALGWRSIDLWRGITAALPTAPALQVAGSLLLAHRQDLGAAQRVLQRLGQAMAHRAWCAPAGQGAPQPLDAQALAELEPAVHGPAHAWYLPGEGQIDPVATLLALHDGAPAVCWHWGQRVVEVAEHGHLVDDNGQRRAFERVIDVRGVGARPQAPVRGVRGETVWLHAPGLCLRRPLRLLHPRHHVYLVPRAGEVVVLGASEVESEDRSPVSLKSAVELMAAAHSVLPDLAEARILRLDVNLRPAYADHAPRVECHGRRLRINGLFRHGWLLAPALVEQALRDTGLGELMP